MCWIAGDSILAEQFHRYRSIAARRARGNKVRRFVLQELEPRIALSHTPTDHIHPILRIEIDGQPVEIPTNIGLEPTRHYSPHTHDTSGTLHIGEGPISGIDPLGSPRRLTILKDFFDVWRTTNTGTPANNPNAYFSQNRILDRVADVNHRVLLSVNGQLNSQFEGYSPHDGDQVLIRYEVLPAITWQNPSVPTDVDGVNGTTPLDALLVINELTERLLSDPETGKLNLSPNPPPFLDVNNDTFLTPLDALLVINALPSKAARAPISSSMTDFPFIPTDQRIFIELAFAELG